VIRAIRYVLTLVLLSLVYRETGVWTMLALLLVNIALELIKPRLLPPNRHHMAPEQWRYPNHP